MGKIRAHIQQALQRPNKSLNEFESLAILRDCGLPATEAHLVTQAADIAKATQNMEFPVVVKGVGPNLLHKSERQLVHLNINDPTAAFEAARQIEVSGSGDVEGFLIQPQCHGQREFMAGLIRDPQFGPVLMFGLGGIHAEALADSSYRLVPLQKSEAFAMMDEIRASALLRAQRGEAAVDHEAQGFLAVTQLLLGSLERGVGLLLFGDVDEGHD